MSSSASTPTPTEAPAATESKHTPPLPEKRLEQIANDACTHALSKTTTYDHAQTASWNTAIINHILRSLISESTPAEGGSPPWKFAVNSTIIQHLSAGGGRRGMHSAQGAYWNNEKDGMWSYKFEHQGMDVVVSVVWIHV